MEEKKKRGRPRKNAPEENKVKRPRGRPKKEVVETGEKRPRGRPRKQIAVTEPQEKRARGRPRKYPVKPEVSGAPRPRGRPRKNPVATEQVKRPRGRPRKDGASPIDAIEQNAVVAENIKAQNVESGQIFAPVTRTPNTADAGNADIQDEIDEDLQKGESYLALQRKTAGIINSNALSPLVPAKHLNENMLDTRPTFARPKSRKKRLQKRQARCQIKLLWLQALPTVWVLQ